MAKRLIGITVGSGYADIVLLRKEGPESFAFEDHTTLNLQSGDRPAAYSVIFGQLGDYVRQHEVEIICVKGSAISMGGTKLAHLEAAELRGVVMAAAAATDTEVRIMNKAAASKSFGSKKVDLYLKDNQFWDDMGLSSVPKGMREAAFTAIAASAK